MPFFNFTLRLFFSVAYYLNSLTFIITMWLIIRFLFQSKCLIKILVLSIYYINIVKAYI